MWQNTDVKRLQFTVHGDFTIIFSKDGLRLACVTFSWILINFEGVNTKNFYRPNFVFCWNGLMDLMCCLQVCDVCASHRWWWCQIVDSVRPHPSVITFSVHLYEFFTVIDSYENDVINLNELVDVHMDLFHSCAIIQLHSTNVIML